MIMSMVTSKSRRKSDFVSFFFYRFLVGLIILSCCWSPTKKSGGVAVVSALIIPQQHHPQRPTSSTSTSSLHQRARTASSTTTSSHVTSTSRVNLIPIQHQRHQLQSSPFRKSSSSSTTTSSTQLCALMDVVGVSPEPIHTAFTVATFFPQPFWLLIILLPNWNVTKKIMGGLEIVLLCSIVHFVIVGTSIVQPDGTGPLAEFNDVFDPSGDPQLAFMNMVTNYPNFVAEEWSHVLTWDLFIGRWIWLDGLRRGIFTGHSVLLSNLIGPPGLLLHAVTCFVTGKGLPTNEALEIVNDDDDMK